MRVKTRTRTLFYVKPALCLHRMSRYLRLTPDEASEESKKSMYKISSDEYKATVKLAIHAPGHTDYVIIFIEHPSVQKKTVKDIYSDWTEWFQEAAWNAGYDNCTFDVCKTVEH